MTYCPRMSTNDTLMYFLPQKTQMNTEGIKERNVSHEGMTYVVTVKAVTWEQVLRWPPFHLQNRFYDSISFFNKRHRPGPSAKRDL